MGILELVEISATRLTQLLARIGLGAPDFPPRSQKWRFLGSPRDILSYGFALLTEAQSATQHPNIGGPKDASQARKSESNPRSGEAHKLACARVSSLVGHVYGP